MKGSGNSSVNKATRARSRIVFVAQSALGAALITVCSWVALPIVPPITLQIFGVLVCSGLLGLRRGVSAFLVWGALGALGLPVFSGFSGGIGVILGPSGGYIVGMLVAALLVGFVSDHSSSIALLLISMIASLLTVYLCGSLWYLWSYAKGASLYDVFVACVLPFVLWDSLKIALALAVTRRLKKYLKNI